MKTLLFALLATVACATQLFAQASPAPNDSSALAAAGTGALTKDERGLAVDYLQQTERDFLAAIAGLSDAQWKFKAAPDRWSIAEVSEHIAVAEDAIWQLISEKIMKSPAAPEKRAEAKGKEEIIMNKIPDRSHKAQAPEQLKPTGRWATQAALVESFGKTRGAEIAYVKETKEDLRSHFEENPVLKTMDAYQWLLFNAAHSKRHTAQILEVKADPNFPKK